MYGQGDSKGNPSSRFSGPSSSKKLSKFPIAAAEAKDILAEILRCFTLPDHAQLIEDWKKEAKTDMTRYVDKVHPWSVRTQIEIIQKSGYPATPEGLIEFQKGVKDLQKEHPDVKELSDRVKAAILPRKPFQLD